jgi:GT2 family glycosyltransferase
MAQHPQAEGRAPETSSELDPDWYRAQYPDVDLLGMDPATHYALFGKALGRRGKPIAQGGRAAPAAPPKPSDTQPVRDLSDVRDFAEDQWCHYSRREAVLSMLARPGLPLVSVVMTAHNCEDTVEAAIESVLMQDYPNLEVVVCDDASTDRTWSILNAMSLRTGGSVRALRLARNSGTYLAKNVAVTEAKGDFIMFQDSDDYSHPMRVACSVEPLLDDPKLIGSRTSYARFNPETFRVIRRGGYDAKLGLITLCVRHSAFKQAGYFDMVRRAGDDEWFRRLRHLYGSKSIRDLSVSLYNAELRDNSLIADMIAHNPDGSIEQRTSTSRRRYVEIFSARFEKPELKRAWYTKSFPPVPARPLEQYPETIAISDHSSLPIIGGICSIPGRLEPFHNVVNRVLPQLDQLHVYLDKYDQIPSFLQSDKITVYRSQDYDVDLRDNAKFLAYDRLKKAHPEGFYYFTLDDDIRYPPDYVHHLRCGIEDYDRKAVVGVHGVVLEEEPRDYFKNRYIFHFQRDELFEPKLVNNLGTGTIAFWSGAFDTINPLQWGAGGMLDIELSIHAYRAGVPMVCLQRHANWLSAIDLPKEDIPLFKEFSAKTDRIATRLQHVQPWGIEAIRNTLNRLEQPTCAKLEGLLPQHSSGLQISRFARRFRRGRQDKALR